MIAVGFTFEAGSILAGVSALIVAGYTVLGRRLNRIDHQVNGRGDDTLHDRLDVIEARLNLLSDKIDGMKGGEGGD